MFKAVLLNRIMEEFRTDPPQKKQLDLFNKKVQML